MPTRKELENTLSAALKAVESAKSDLRAFDTAAENNVYPSLEDAEYEVTEKLLEIASDDCEGAHSVGAPKYTAEFMVDGVTHIGTLKVEYNRHDKTYYYVDGHKFSYVVRP